jgi:hypothetical protein
MGLSGSSGFKLTIHCVTGITLQDFLGRKASTSSSGPSSYLVAWSKSQVGPKYQ